MWGTTSIIVIAWFSTDWWWYDEHWPTIYVANEVSLHCIIYCGGGLQGYWLVNKNVIFSQVI